MGRAGRHIPFDHEEPLPGAAPPPFPQVKPAKGEPLWVFGYGSLMWDPGFPHTTVKVAKLWGFHRGFCVWSHRYRGTPAAPGLVLGLMPGGSCKGRAFRVRRADQDAVIDYLYRREMVTGVYRPGFHLAQMGDGSRVKVLAFVADPQHPQYAGHLSEAEVVRIIASRSGQRGPNAAYLASTVQHLDALGIADGPLHRILAEVRATGAQV